ncbi:hypothetical protein M1523_01935 [Patescibacteria group bacterium]|nr:hypothetical protein [Patescibacteria group bacterium]
MRLLIHESVHLACSLLVAVAVWWLYRPAPHLSFVIAAALAGGLFVDLDHLVDYFLAFGWRFNPRYFAKGYQFLKSDRIIIPLHAWEIVIGGFLIFFYLGSLKNPADLTMTRSLLLAFASSLGLHLAYDTVSNRIPWLSYSLIRRISVKFALRSLVFPAHYRKHLEEKKLMTFAN